MLRLAHLGHPSRPGGATRQRGGWPVQALPALAAAVLWGLALHSGASWWLRLAAQPPLQAPTVAPSVAAPTEVDTAAVARALGAGAVPASPVAAPASAVLAAPWQLLGVVRQGQTGAALLRRDGQPARSVRVGQALGDGWTLLAIGPRSARLGTLDGTSSLELTLPAPTASTPAPPSAGPPGMERP